ncbi:hypothetical protein C0995_001068, partial [Termitomyces sp. Mi166
MVVLLFGGYIPQYSKKLYYKDRLDEWHRLNPGNLATGNLFANAIPDAQQQQAMNNMQAPYTPNNFATPNKQQEGAYKTLVPAATKEQEWNIKAFNTIWNHNITMTVEGALAISQLLRNHFQEMVMPKQITNANMVTISEIPNDNTDDALPYLGKSPSGTYTFNSNTNTHNDSVIELTGTFGAVDPVEAFYNHWPLKHCASLWITKDTDSLRAIMAVINGKEE